MSTQVTKRVASIYIDAAAANKSLKDLQSESAKLYNELRKLPRGSDEFIAKAKEYRNVQAQLKATKEEVAGTNSVFGRLKAGLGPLAGAMGLAFGGAAVIQGIQHAREEFLEHEKAVDRVTQALKNNGEQSGQTASGLVQASDAMELKSLYSAEDILTQVSTQLLNFGNIANDKFTRAQQVSLDLATTLGGDLQGATMAVGKALSSPVDGLSKLQKMGVKFSEDQKAVITTLVETGKAAEAQDMVLAELEKRYAGQAEAAARNEAGTRKLDQAMGDLVEGSGSFFNAALQDLAGGLGDMIGAFSDLIGLTSRESDELQGQRAEMNALFNVLKSGNITQEQQAELVERINREYKDYLPTAISVTDSTEALEMAQRGANQAMLEQIQLLAKKELLEEAQKEAVDRKKDALQAQVTAAKAAQGELSAWEKTKLAVMQPTMIFTPEVAMEANSQVAQLAAQHAQKEYEKLINTLGTVESAQKAVNDVTMARMDGAEGGGPTVSPEVAEETSKRAQEVRDALKQAAHDQEMDRLDGKDKEIRQVEEKYHKLAQLAEGSGVGLEEIQAQQDQELAAVRSKYGKKEFERLTKLDEDLRKMRDSQWSARLSVEQKQEVEAIDARYEAQRVAIGDNQAALAQNEQERRAEIDAVLESQRVERQQATDEAELQQVRDKYAKLLEEAEGNKDRLLQVQDLLAMELEAKELEQEEKRQERLLAKQEAQDEFEASIQQKKLEMYEQELDLMASRHERELEMAQEQEGDIAALLAQQAAERAPLEEELRQAELDALNAHFETLYATADEHGIDTAMLQQQHAEALLLMKQDFLQREVDANEDKNNKIKASDEMMAKARADVTSGIMQITGDLFAMSAADADEAADYQKMLTLFELGIDTASAMGSLTAMSEANPANAATGGLAGIAQWVAGIARITGNIAKATQILSKPKPKPPAYAIGGETAPQGMPVFSKRSATGGRAGMEEVMSYFDDALGTTVNITKPAQDISVGGMVPGPTMGLFGEKGPEWVAPAWQYSNPTLQPVFDWLEGMRQEGRVPAFEVGGDTSRTTTTVTERVRSLTNSTETNSIGGQLNVAELNATIQQLAAVLQAPISAVMSYDQLQDSNERIGDLENRSNLNA